MNSTLTNGIKPIETLYAGYKFRSRLEARWAVFFNRSGIEFEYEPEGYNLGSAGCYLPDFWLPEVWERGTHKGVFVEIKPNMEAFTKECEEKAEALVMGTGHPLILCCGLPIAKDDFGVSCSALDDGCHEYILPEPGHSNRLGWDNYMHFQGGPSGFYIEYHNHNYDHGCHESLFLAVEASKQARFEHGEAYRGIYK